ncbi:MAG: anhydro-N-acetylmuramic acid kinase [Bacteroidota bacterium]
MQDEYITVGVMSGSSLDGLDIVAVRFYKTNKWNFEILDGDTYPYTLSWRQKLMTAHQLGAFEFLLLHKEYGKFIGEMVNNFLEDFGYDVDLIASHGHTIFHQPEKGITFQIGDGYSIAALTRKTVVSDFRSMDVALGGQGAPLVPIGDMLLFEEYDYCINLGGFANISFNQAGKRYAFDICPVNTVINYYSNILNLEFDRDGKIGNSGNLNTELLHRLNNILYYNSVSPKSLGIEWVMKEFIPIVESYNIPIEDKMRTLYEHIAVQISLSTTFKKDCMILITGGGAYNTFLIKLIRKRINHSIFIPDEQIVDFKEAMIFAFLGVLRSRNEYNCMASVTGARTDCICGLTHRT